MTTFQHQFGQAAIDSIIGFCRNDIPTVAHFENNDFAHISDAQLRTAVAKTMYGARWLYKVGLSLLIDGDEAIAHVRTQVIDYGSVCEALLSDVVIHGISNGYFAGQIFRTASGDGNGRPINWGAGNMQSKVKKRSFYWLIEVAREEGILTPHEKGLLTRLRNLRNTVHITELATTNQNYYRTLAKDAYSTVHSTVAATRQWKNANP